MTNEIADQHIEIDLDFEEGFLSKQLEESLMDLELLEKDRETIASPDSLGKVVLDEVWKQFGNQIGLDITNETLIQKYDREHPEEYKDVAVSVMQDQRYKDANKAMREQQQAGNLKDSYTGKKIKQNEQANLDHVVSRKELYENPRRKQAGLSTKDLANKDENLKPTNEPLNKSKGAKSNKEYIETREARQKSLIEQNKKANKKIDESNLSDEEKRSKKDKNNKRLQDKLDADDNLMMQADKEARNAINRDIFVGVTKEVGKKAGKDAIKAMAVSALFALLKEIMNGLVRFFKDKAKSFDIFLSEMKKSLKAFFTKIDKHLQTGKSTFIGTILSEIFGPIVSIFKKLASIIKQGVSSVMDAVNYLRDKKNKDKPFSIKVAQIGKIITAGLAGSSALLLGEVFEKSLLTVPGMQINIPLVGTLANMISLFLSSLVSGLIGSLVLNFIDKFIAKTRKEAKDREIIAKKNEILNIQHAQQAVAKNNIVTSKKNAMGQILHRHQLAKESIQESLNEIFNEHGAESHKATNAISDNQRALIEMQKDLENLI